MTTEIHPVRPPPFVSGSTMRHVVIMTLTSAIGIMALFLVDLIDLFFLSLLKETDVTAAIGYAAAIVLFNLSVAIGNSIAAAVLVARNVGVGDVERARQYATSALLFSLIVSGLITLVITVGSGHFLSFLGAEGNARELAQSFIWTLTPGYLLVGGELCCAGILRGLGDARRAMYLTLASAVVTLVADPILIFGLGLGIKGAAIATALGYVASFSLGLYALIKIHKFLDPFTLSALKRDFPEIWSIAYPAILSQMTLPFTNAYLTHLIAAFGDGAVAGFAIICRLIPVAYSVIFALSGAVGPIIGQNYGARRHDRVRHALTDGLIFSTIYALAASLFLFLFRYEIANAFNAVGRANEIIIFFCTFIALSWTFVGAQFLANAGFNNLGYPKLSLTFNWGRAFGAIPFALVGAKFGGAEGVLVGNALGAVIFGVTSTITAYLIVNRLSP